MLESEKWLSSGHVPYCLRTFISLSVKQGESQSPGFPRCCAAWVRSHVKRIRLWPWSSARTPERLLSSFCKVAAAERCRLEEFRLEVLLGQVSAQSCFRRPSHTEWLMTGIAITSYVGHPPAFKVWITIIKKRVIFPFQYSKLASVGTSWFLWAHSLSQQKELVELFFCITDTITIANFDLLSAYYVSFHSIPMLTREWNNSATWNDSLMERGYRRKMGWKQGGSE